MALAPSKIIDVAEGFGGSASVPVSPKARAQLEDMERADNTLARLGWAGVGVTPKTAALMESMEAFTKGKILRTIDATHGSMLRASASSLTRMVELEEDMMKIRAKYEPRGEMAGQTMGDEDMARMDMLHRQWVDCVKIQVQCNVAANNAANTRLMIDAKVKELQNSDGRRGSKPVLKRVASERRGGKS